MRYQREKNFKWLNIRKKIGFISMSRNGKRLKFFFVKLIVIN